MLADSTFQSGEHLGFLVTQPVDSTHILFVTSMLHFHSLFHGKLGNC